MDDIAKLKLRLINQILQTNSLELLNTIEEILNLSNVKKDLKVLNDNHQLPSVDKKDIDDIQGNLDQIFGGR